MAVTASLGPATREGAVPSRRVLYRRLTMDRFEAPTQRAFLSEDWPENRRAAEPGTAHWAIKEHATAARPSTRFRGRILIK